MSDDDTLDLPGVSDVAREIRRQMDAALGNVPMQKRTLDQPIGEFPARALRFYGSGRAPILE